MSKSNELLYLLESKEELIFSRKVFKGKKPIDRSNSIKSLNPKIGKILVLDIESNGSGKEVFKVTKIDNEGIWGTIANGTTRVE